MHTANHEAPATERLAQNLRQLVGEADDLLKGAAQSGEEHLDSAKARLASQLHQLRQQIDELEDTLVQRTRKAVKATDEAVHAHPYTAMGLAGLAGVLLGAIIARR